MNKVSSSHVSIIVLNWNNHSDTIECVESLKKISYPKYTLIIVDNGSTDGSENIIRQKYPDLPFIQTGRNKGYAGGINAGLKYAFETGADYIFILNNDTIANPKALEELVKAASDDKRIGMLSSKIYFYDRPNVIWYAGASFHPILGWGRHRGYNEVDTGQFDVTEETGRPCGSSMMVTREFCEQVGLLNEDFFCYVEEVDWGLRCRKAGFRVMYVPSSKIWHKVSSSTGGVSTGVYLYYSVRNTLLCINTNTPLPFIFRLLRYGAVIMIFGISLFTMRVPKILGMKRIYQGARDYFQGHMGEFSGG
jgi:GT2 family glycosyltransferase